MLVNLRCTPLTPEETKNRIPECVAGAPPRLRPLHTGKGLHRFTAGSDRFSPRGVRTAYTRTGAVDWERLRKGLQSRKLLCFPATRLRRRMLMIDCRRRGGDGGRHRTTRDLKEAPRSVRDGQINELAAGEGKAAAAGRLEPSEYLLGPFDLGLGRGENLMEGV